MEGRLKNTGNLDFKNKSFAFIPVEEAPARGWRDQRLVLVNCRQKYIIARVNASKSAP